MRKFVCSSVLFLQLILCELSVANFVSGEELFTGEAAAPVYKRGETWTYRAATKRFYGSTSRSVLNGEYDIILLPGRRLVMHMEDGRQVEEKAPGALVVMLPTRGFLQSNKAQYFQFPLAVGKKWRTSYWSDGYRRQIDPEATVTGIENVTTPAGVFSAYRIERGFASTRSFPGLGETIQVNVNETYFYSPHVRSVVNYHYQLDFTSGGDRSLYSTVDIELLKAHQ